MLGFAPIAGTPLATNSFRQFTSAASGFGYGSGVSAYDSRTFACYEQFQGRDVQQPTNAHVSRVSAKSTISKSSPSGRAGNNGCVS